MIDKEPESMSGKARFYGAIISDAEYRELMLDNSIEAWKKHKLPNGKSAWEQSQNYAAFTTTQGGTSVSQTESTPVDVEVETSSGNPENDSQETTIEKIKRLKGNK